MKNHFFSKKCPVDDSFCFVIFTFLSQSPEGINYQAVMRNGLTLAANQNINVKFELKKVTGRVVLAP